MQKTKYIIILLFFTVAGFAQIAPNVDANTPVIPCKDCPEDLDNITTQVYTPILSASGDTIGYNNATLVDGVQTDIDPVMFPVQDIEYISSDSTINIETTILPDGTTQVDYTVDTIKEKERLLRCLVDTDKDGLPDVFDPVPNDSCINVTICEVSEPPIQADFSVTKVNNVASDSLSLGSNFSYTIEVTHLSGDNTSITATDVLPSCAAYVSDSGGPNTTFDAATNTLTFNTLILSAGQSQVIQVDAIASETTTCTNNVTLADDLDNSNNSASNTTVVCQLVAVDNAALNDFASIDNANNIVTFSQTFYPTGLTGAQGTVGGLIQAPLSATTVAGGGNIWVVNNATATDLLLLEIVMSDGSVIPVNQNIIGNGGFWWMPTIYQTILPFLNSSISARDLRDDYNTIDKVNRWAFWASFETCIDEPMPYQIIFQHESDPSVPIILQANPFSIQ